eukprot:5699028-Prymnesium_polylepis.1
MCGHKQYFCSDIAKARTIRSVGVERRPSGYVRGRANLDSAGLQTSGPSATPSGRRTAAR